MLFVFFAILTCDSSGGARGKGGTEPTAPCRNIGPHFGKTQAAQRKDKNVL